MMDKKGMLDDLFDVLFTVMAAFFILIFMGIIIGGSAEVPEGNLGNFDAGNNLLVYLKSPISDTENMADLIIQWHYDKDRYAKELRSESTKILKGLPLPPASEGWGIRIFSPDDVEEIEITPSGIIGDYESWNAFVSLPLIKEDKYLKVEIHLECQDDRCK